MGGGVNEKQSLINKTAKKSNSQLIKNTIYQIQAQMNTHSLLSGCTQYQRMMQTHPLQIYLDRVITDNIMKKYKGRDKMTNPSRNHQYIVRTLFPYQFGTKSSRILLVEMTHVLLSSRRQMRRHLDNRKVDGSPELRCSRPCSSAAIATAAKRNFVAFS